LHTAGPGLLEYVRGVADREGHDRGPTRSDHRLTVGNAIVGAALNGTHDQHGGNPRAHE
jgi:hypothetical protein